MIFPCKDLKRSFFINLLYLQDIVLRYVLTYNCLYLLKREHAMPLLQ